MKNLVKLMKDESGATAIEYGLIAALISVFCIIAMQFVGSGLNTTFNQVGGALSGGQAG